MVRHYKERGSGIRYWEVANEPDIGEDGGCPYGSNWTATPTISTRLPPFFAPIRLRVSVARVSKLEIADSACSVRILRFG